jgi:glutamate N-acetyltransferase / amino-acid N-acetyltransferase
MKKYIETSGGVTAPQGFRAGGLSAGIRKVKKDLALIVSDSPAAIGAVFTQNKAVAAPIVVDRSQFRSNKTCTAIIVNSGNANACTGERGLNDAWAMVDATALALSLPRSQVLVSSTGVIGQYLPIEKVLHGIEQLANQISYEGSLDAAQAIMTTDTYSKELAVTFEIDGKQCTVGGIAKGSGMIAPNMATMLAFITTDVNIPQPLLQKTFAQAINQSFNRISVDGDMSTNDMSTVMANGRAGNAPLEEGTPKYELFAEALEYVLVKLAKMIARDGEGATKLVEVVVCGADSESDALAAARSVANSNLVKTAIHGQDANWGRILAAVGYSGIEFDPAEVQLSINELEILGKNYDIVLDEVKAKSVLAQEEITIKVDLNQGKQSACFWTCDLSNEYVRINASYRS